jgi:hypothetical protein
LWRKDKTVILLVVLYGCKTWSLSLRGQRMLREFENRLLRGIFVHNKVEMTGEECRISGFIVRSPRLLLLGWSNVGGRDGRNI